MSSCVIEHFRCLEMDCIASFSRLLCAASDEEEEGEQGESIDKAVVAEEPFSSSSSSTAARFLPREGPEEGSEVFDFKVAMPTLVSEWIARPGAV